MGVGVSTSNPEEGSSNKSDWSSLFTIATTFLSVDLAAALEALTVGEKGVLGVLGLLLENCPLFSFNGVGDVDLSETCCM